MREGNEKKKRRSRADKKFFNVEVNCGDRKDVGAGAPGNESIGEIRRSQAIGDDYLLCDSKKV
jgi:hypothetical protein